MAAHKNNKSTMYINIQKNAKTPKEKNAFKSSIVTVALPLAKCIIFMGDDRKTK
jgi:hypothetical protein